ncbi:Bug family tripartite tricarboxylate transporter substrate binding protein [Paracidovorax wautersii]|uniref:Tripartite-type tricarboxylate transporter, receptor component TctC n=1 Tax=Paracidovorax wautersii TaxID=1177982 RepID=A0A1I1ZNF6_9BURK|nr:tripartite tricarboxylate transporter substrate binding protein [Paracidovorax wautersii]SFE33185.1 Tripartite-type tricarboxylate transporter, receptor component TctC [Paracidovorax wautersii]
MHRPPLSSAHGLSRRQLLQAGAASALAGTSLHALAADTAWPGKVIKMVVAFPAGGPTDTVARITAQKLGERLGTTIVVDNRPGASGSIGTASFIKSAPDGNTLSMFGMPALLAPLMYNNNAYDVEKDFLCVATVYDLVMGIVVNPEVLPGVDSLQALIAKAKTAKPPLNYTSSGTGSFGHLAMEQLKDLGGFDMLHVPYRGSAPAVTDLLGGQLGVMFADLVAALPHIRAGKLRAIALSSPRGRQMLPGVKTVAEQGFPGFDFDSWGGLIAPLGTPAPVITRLNRELKDILTNDQEVKDKLLQVGAIASYQPADAMRKRLLADRARWTRIAKDKNISAVG